MPKRPALKLWLVILFLAGLLLAPAARAEEKKPTDPSLAHLPPLDTLYNYFGETRLGLWRTRQGYECACPQVHFQVDINAGFQLFWRYTCMENPQEVALDQRYIRLWIRALEKAKRWAMLAADKGVNINKMIDNWEDRIFVDFVAEDGGRRSYAVFINRDWDCPMVVTTHDANVLGGGREISRFISVMQGSIHRMRVLMKERERQEQPGGSLYDEFR